MIVADYIIQRMEQAGISHIFGIPGVHNLELYRSLNDSKITHIVGRHEQSLGFMADGYHRATGKVAGVFSITGCGFANLLTPLGQANNCSSRMLVIATTNDLKRLDRVVGDLHEIDGQAELAKYSGATSYFVKDKTVLPVLLERAFSDLNRLRPAPATLHIPKAMLAEHIDVALPHHPVFKLPSVDIGDLTLTLDALKKAQYPVLLVGGGVVGSEILLEKLIEHIPAAVVMTNNARGVIAQNNPLAVSCSASLDEVRALISKGDFVLSLGTEWGRTDYFIREKMDYTLHVPHHAINLSQTHLLRHPHLTLGMVGDVKASLAWMVDALNDQPKKEIPNGMIEDIKTAQRTSFENVPASYQSIIDMLNWMQEKAPNVPMVGDSTQPTYAGNYVHGCMKPRLWFNSAMGFGALGFGLPAANGAAIALNEKVICLSGDGGLQFSLSEIGTMAELNLPVILFIWNNSGYWEILDRMEKAQISTQNTSPRPPKFDKLAAAWDVHYLHPLSLDEFKQNFEEALSHNGPVIMEIKDELAFQWFPSL